MPFSGNNIYAYSMTYQGSVLMTSSSSTESRGVELATLLESAKHDRITTLNDLVNLVTAAGFRDVTIATEDEFPKIPSFLLPPEEQMAA